MKTTVRLRKWNLETEWTRLEEQKRGVQKDFQVSGLSYLLGDGIYLFREIRKIGRVADSNSFISFVHSFNRHLLKAHHML